MKRWQYRYRNGIAIPHGKLEEDTLRAVGVFVQLETPIAFDAIDNQPVDLLFALLVPADQTKTHLHTLSLVAKRLADKTICVDCAQPKVMKSFIRLSLKQKAIRMTRNQEMAFTSVVLRRNGTWC